MTNKEIVVFIRIFILSFFILGFSLSCSEKNIPFEEQFNLKRFKLRHFDLYNPILHTFKLDPIKRKEHPNYYYFDVYYDVKGIVRYSFYRSGSYGYLQEFFYNNTGRVTKAIVYPILVSSIHRTAEINVNEYYYIDGKLKVYRDELNEELILGIGDSVFIYEGIMSSGTKPFRIKKINPNEYFIPLLH